MTKRFLLFCAIWLAAVPVARGQMTGKIAGVVMDANTSEPLPGAQVIVTARWQGNREVPLSRVMGAAADERGRFFILNVPPGVYTIKVQMIGYETLVLKRARVHVNRTLEINARLKPTVIQGEEVVVTAPEIQVRKDQTSSVRNVSADKISKLPVESIGQVVSLQPGVVVGHFRGGRSGEVSYLIDGIEVTEAFTRSGRTVNVSPEAVQEVEVITGTFNAEYGRAMSGVVNIVTKEGGDHFNFTGLVNYGNYLTPHKDIFIGLKDLDIRTKDYRFTLSGPVFGGITFFANLRYQDNLGHLNGIYRFRPDDYSDFHGDSTQWISE
ncbi:MAG TPA: TonB-dependent receptor, partial [Bacteroidetes bacterium]|nr:TonB-dependent receptor [Bacteroidota bacterium]